MVSSGWSGRLLNPAPYQEQVAPAVHGRPPVPFPGLHAEHPGHCDFPSSIVTDLPSAFATRSSIASDRQPCSAFSIRQTVCCQLPMSLSIPSGGSAASTKSLLSSTVAWSSSAPFHQIVQDEAVAAAEGFDKLMHILTVLHGEREHLQTGRPALDAAFQGIEIAGG